MFNCVKAHTLTTLAQVRIPGEQTPDGRCWIWNLKSQEQQSMGSVYRLFCTPAEPRVEEVTWPKFYIRRLHACTRVSKLMCISLCRTVSIPSASHMVARCCFWGLEWHGGSCHLSAVQRVKKRHGSLSRLVYNELDASQDVSSRTSQVSDGAFSPQRAEARPGSQRDDQKEEEIVFINWK